jgi:hypothetical protein
VSEASPLTPQVLAEVAAFEWGPYGRFDDFAPGAYGVVGLEEIRKALPLVASRYDESAAKVAGVGLPHAAHLADAISRGATDLVGAVELLREAAGFIAAPRDSTEPSESPIWMARARGFPRPEPFWQHRVRTLRDLAAAALGGALSHAADASFDQRALIERVGYRIVREGHRALPAPCGRDEQLSLTYCLSDWARRTGWWGAAPGGAIR